jgi:hypothetical protein
MVFVQALRPNIFVSVPRLWNRIYDRVMAQIRESNPIKRALFEKAYAYKRAALEAGDLSGGRWGPLFDKLVFSKIRDRVGGEVKYMTTGKLYESYGVPIKLCAWRGRPSSAWCKKISSEAILVQVQTGIDFPVQIAQGL